MKKLLTFFVLFLALQAQAFAQAWNVGQQPVQYHFPHVLGDGSDVRGGQAPYFSSGEIADIVTDPAIASVWTGTCTNVIPKPPTGGSGTYCSGEYADSAGANGWGVGHEAKARFDCNDTAEENSDPIVKPGQAGTNSHRHEFFGNTGAAGNMQLVTYSYLRQHGYASCYGGPMNRTLYWHPTLYVIHNGIPLPIKAANVVTYYLCNLNSASATNSIDPASTATCTRWPRGFAEIAGFDMNDPNGTRITNKINNVGGTFTDNPSQYSGGAYNGLSGWICPNNTWATPSYTPYSAVQVQGAPQPYFNDGQGHVTIQCTTGTYNGIANSFMLENDINFPECWDGKNPQSPDGRSHVQQSIRDNRTGSGVRICPDGWYYIPQFSAHIQFIFKDANELATAYLSSDRMPGMTQFKGGQTMHADVFPAWDYGTGDKPGFMLKFFQHCLGLTMHVKNSDGTTYTDLPGDPHECNFGRVSADTNTTTSNSAPPECALAAPAPCPTPVVNLNLDFTGIKRYFPLPSGTTAPGLVLHQKGGGGG